MAEIPSMSLALLPNYGGLSEVRGYLDRNDNARLAVASTLFRDEARSDIRIIAGRILGRHFTQIPDAYQALSHKLFDLTKDPSSRDMTTISQFQAVLRQARREIASQTRHLDGAMLGHLWQYLATNPILSLEEIATRYRQLQPDEKDLFVDRAFSTRELFFAGAPGILTEGELLAVMERKGYTIDPETDLKGKENPTLARLFFRVMQAESRAERALRHAGTPGNFSIVLSLFYPSLDMSRIPPEFISRVYSRVKPQSTIQELLPLTLLLDEMKCHGYDYSAFAREVLEIEDLNEASLKAAQLVGLSIEMGAPVADQLAAKEVRFYAMYTTSEEVAERIVSLKFVEMLCAVSADPTILVDLASTGGAMLPAFLRRLSPLQLENLWAKAVKVAAETGRFTILGHKALPNHHVETFFTHYIPKVETASLRDDFSDSEGEEEVEYSLFPKGLIHAISKSFDLKDHLVSDKKIARAISRSVRYLQSAPKYMHSSQPVYYELSLLARELSGTQEYLNAEDMGNLVKSCPEGDTTAPMIQSLRDLDSKLKRALLPETE